MYRACCRIARTKTGNRMHGLINYPRQRVSIRKKRGQIDKDRPVGGARRARPQRVASLAPTREQIASVSAHTYTRRCVTSAIRVSRKSRITGQRVRAYINPARASPPPHPDGLQPASPRYRGYAAMERHFGTRVGIESRAMSHLSRRGFTTLRTLTRTRAARLKRACPLPPLHPPLISRAPSSSFIRLLWRVVCGGVRPHEFNRSDTRERRAHTPLAGGRGRIYEVSSAHTNAKLANSGDTYTCTRSPHIVTAHWSGKLSQCVRSYCSSWGSHVRLIARTESTKHAEDLIEAGWKLMKAPNDVNIPVMGDFLSFPSERKVTRTDAIRLHLACSRDFNSFIFISYERYESFIACRISGELSGVIDRELGERRSQPVFPRFSSFRHLKKRYSLNSECEGL